jgi:ABC-type antimicrobial peptide transport system permease subunit
MKSYFLQAVRGITHNKSRTFLTTLGIMIGIGTVVLVLSAGEGFKSYINAQIELYGSNTVYIETVIPLSTKQRNANENTSGNIQNNAATNAVPVKTLKNKDILFEFLIEAVLLTLLGGIVGILGGALFAYVIAKVAQSFNFAWSFIVPLYGIILAVSISAIIGIVFGVFPARSASKLNPIEALNKE